MSIQPKIWLAVGLGLVFGWIPCMLHAWTKSPTFKSIKPCPDGSKQLSGYTCESGPARPLVDEWSWPLLNKWYGNSEDGVSGQYAYVWQACGTNQCLVPYYSTFSTRVPIWMRAYAWSMWRNNANNLKRPLRGDSLTGTV